MSAVYIYFQAKPHKKIEFKSPLKDFLVEKYPKLIQFDADQSSDSFHVQIGIKLIEESDKVILHIEQEEKTALGSLIKALEALRKKKKEVLILESQIDTKLAKILKLLNAKHSNEDHRLAIKGFLKQG